MASANTGRIPALGGWRNIAILAIASAVIVSRRPDALLQAQFYTEDGKVFFADAYNLGWWRALLIPYAGYLHTVPRLAAGLALAAPLRYAPLTLNIIAILFAALPACLLLSSGSAAWGSMRLRVLLIALYLALPGTWEIGFGVSYAQWPLALSALLLLVISERPRPSGVVLLLLFSLTGPFVFLLVPLPAYRFLRHRRGACELVILGLGCCAQATAMLLTFAAARHVSNPLGASPRLFCRILASDVYASTLLGSSDLGVLPGHGAAITLWVVGGIGLAVQSYCLARAPQPFRLLTAFSLALFVLALALPGLGQVGGTAWHALLMAPGAHYWFLPELGFAWAIAWMASCNDRLVLRGAGYLLLVLMCLGIVRDWHRRDIPDLNFAAQAARFADLSRGAGMTIPINPAGWTMRLVKH